jgi:hypothetical protein
MQIRGVRVYALLDGYDAVRLKLPGDYLDVTDKALPSELKIAEEILKGKRDGT